jgi:hypothetical protein
MLETLLTQFYARTREKLKINPGIEFQLAFQEAIRQGATVVLGDRPVNVSPFSSTFFIHIFRLHFNELGRL